MKKIDANCLKSYIDDNRSKIDESLVSLRFMKEVDDFLDFNDISQRKLAEDIGYTEAYISQLMSGVKKINTSFINKFEKKYDIKVEFKIRPKRDFNYIISFPNTYAEINLNMHNVDLINPISIIINKRFCDFSDIETNSNILSIESNG